jgi:hypothetical protein
MVGTWYGTRLILGIVYALVLVHSWWYRLRYMFMHGIGWYLDWDTYLVMVCGDVGTWLVEACVGDVEHMVGDMFLVILAWVSCGWEWILFRGWDSEKLDRMMW